MNGLVIFFILFCRLVFSPDEVRCDIQNETCFKHKQVGSIQVNDLRMYSLFNKNHQMEVLCEGFKWTEGPVYIPQNRATREQAYVLFSDTQLNSIWKWEEGKGCSLFIAESGTNTIVSDERKLFEPGSNGLDVDPITHSLTAAQHGNRQVVILGTTTIKEIVADNYQGKKLNSPNDLVYTVSGDLYFTDPSFGLQNTKHEGEVFPGVAQHWTFTESEQGTGVYFRKRSENKLTRVISDMKLPNGVGLSPDQKKLYVTESFCNGDSWNPDRSDWHIRAYDILSDGTLTNPTVFYNLTKAWKENNNIPVGFLDGMCIDEFGNLYVTAASAKAILVISPDGTLIGILFTESVVSNCVIGDDYYLYLSASEKLLRVPIFVKSSRQNPTLLW